MKIIRHWKLKIRNSQAGMTYVELVVVLSIFSIMSSIVMTNFNKFQEKVDIKNLANDIALKIVEAQKSAMAGKLPNKNYSQVSDWKPSYGLSFDLRSSVGNSQITGPNFFYLFTDLDANKFFDPSSFCSTAIDSSECLDKIILNKNTISNIAVIYFDSHFNSPSLNNLALSFTRPDSKASFSSDTLLLNDVDYAQITISSPQNVSANIKVYASGRIQIN